MMDVVSSSVRVDGRFFQKILRHLMVLVGVLGAEFEALDTGTKGFRVLQTRTATCQTLRNCSNTYLCAVRRVIPISCKSARSKTWTTVKPNCLAPIASFGSTLLDFACCGSVCEGSLLYAIYDSSLFTKVLLIGWALPSPQEANTYRRYS